MTEAMMTRTPKRGSPTAEESRTISVVMPLSMYEWLKRQDGYISTIMRQALIDYRQKIETSDMPPSLSEGA